MKRRKRSLSVKVLVLALILTLAMPAGVFASATELQADSTEPGLSLAGKYPAYTDIDFQWSKTEDATHQVEFPTTMSKAEFDAVGEWSFSLDRDTERPYLDPELYPYNAETTIGDINNVVDKEKNKCFDVTDVSYSDGKIVVTINTTGTEYYYTKDEEAKAKGYAKVYSIDHTNGGKWLDNCGYYDFNLKNGDQIVSSVHAKVVPYDTYHTIYEVYDTVKALGEYKGDRYVETGSIGHSSIDGYDTPYIIIADSKEDVEKWQAYTELSENDPTQVLADIKAGKYDDLAAPIYLSNCHTNENSAVNGLINFAEYLVYGESDYSTKNGKVSLNTLESYTKAGKALLEKEKKDVFGTAISDLYSFCSELGRLRGEYGDTKQSYGYSAPIDDLSKYYNMGKDEFDVDELLDDVFYIIVPTMNVEGYTQSTRATGVGFDPNRDYANQVQNENRNAMRFMSDWNPMAYCELHGRVAGYSVEPCGAPHNPNIEYDLIVKQFFEMGEAVGNAMVANNERFNSYELCGRDYIEIDENSPTGVQWGQPWDDLSTNFGSQFPVFYGTAGITWEQPAYDDITAQQSIPAGCYGIGRYVQQHHNELLTSQATLFERGVNNYNSNEEVSKYYVNQYDEPGAQADLMRPVFDGEGQNGNFYPECYIIPMDKAHQKNIQDAAESVLWVARNHCKYKIAEKSFEYDGVTYPAGTVVVSMYQAKRSLVNANFGPGSFVNVWKGLYSEAYSQFSMSRGFDQITVAEPAAYKVIDAACVDGPDYDGTLELFADFTAQFSGVEGADVIISNASEDTAKAVNALLNAEKTVAMITEGEYMGDFICSYDDFMAIVANEYTVAAEGVYGAGIKAKIIDEAPTVYITGAYKDGYYTGGNTELPGGNAYMFDKYAINSMGFKTTSKALRADVILGAALTNGNSQDDLAKQAVLAGKPYMVWGSGSRLTGILDGVVKASHSGGTDMSAIVKYPEVSLINANYALDEDYVNYQYGTAWYKSLPEGAKVLVQNAGKDPITGCLAIFNDDMQKEFDEYNTSPVAFEYKNDDLDIVAFANTLTHKGHSQDEFKYIANFVFSKTASKRNYVGTAKQPEAPKTVKLSGTKLIYNGQVRNPYVIAYAADGTRLVKGTDYTVTYAAGRKAVGKYKVTVKFQGNYTGTKTLYFTISPATPTVKSLTPGTNKLTVRTYSKPSVKGASSYQIAYRVKGTTTWKYTTTTSTYKTIKYLKKGKVYQVKMRALKTVNGTKYTSNWSKIKTSTKIK